MSSQYKQENHSDNFSQQSKVKLTDLLSRINQEILETKYLYSVYRE